MIKDKNIGYKFKFHTIDAMEFGFDALSGEGLATAGCTYEEIGTTGVGGITYALSGQVCRYVMVKPSDWDFDNDIFVRVVFATLSTTTAHTIDWTVTVGGRTFGEAILSAGNALSTPITQSTNEAVAAAPQASAAGIIDGGLVGGSTDDFLVFDVEMDAFAAGLTAQKSLMALQFAYTPKLTDGPQQAPNLGDTDPWADLD